MNVRALFPQGALSLDQWQRVEELGRTLEPAQARWVSFYFAGLDAGLSRTAGDDPPVEAALEGRTLTILYGSETGNSADLARSLASAAGDRGRRAELADMADYKVRRLRDEQDLLIICSTHGEGDPPQNAIGFFEYLEGRKAPRLEGIRFAVLALGDSTYEKYCEAGKRLDRRLEELGAERIEPRVDCDVDYEEAADTWIVRLAERLAASEGASPWSAVAASPSASTEASPFDKRNPFPAPVIENLKIVGRSSSKETRHIELDLSGSGLRYEPGDAIGIQARNDPTVVASLLEATRLEPDTPVTLKGGRLLSLGEALESEYEIMIAAPRFLEHWAGLSGASELQALLGESQAPARLAWLQAHHVVDIVRAFPVPGLDAAGLVGGLRPLQPRLYSIASSLGLVPDEAHVTLAPVRYALHGEDRSGVASAHLADRAGPDAILPVFIQPNPHFRLPADDVPIIMVGAGTGIAPFRAFLQEREARGASGRSWLFFGERNFRSDFLYQLEWQAWLKEGQLSRIDLAFSRDAADRIYVQQRMRERAAELYAWLEEGAHFYVCGDAARMAPDVHQALIEIVAAGSGGSPEAASEYVSGLQRDRRYQRDVY